MALRTIRELRWWFEDRDTGKITVVQFPNWPIWGIVACWFARQAVTSGTTPHDLLGWSIRGLWLVWGVGELARGVNPFRRALGAAVIVWQLLSIALS